MKKIAFFVIVIFLATSCTKECWQGAGEDTTEKRTLESFHQIDIIDNFDIHFIQDSLSYVVLEGKSNLIQHIETSVSKGILSITDNNVCKLTKGYHDNSIYIHFKSLDLINLEGSSNLYSEDSLIFDKLFINTNSDITTWNIKIDANKFDIQLHAVVGELTICGKADNVYFYSSGRAHCYFKDLITKKASINHSSQGDFYLTVSEELNLDINHSGDLYCYGNPQKKTISVEKNSTGQAFFLTE